MKHLARARARELHHPRGRVRASRAVAFYFIPENTDPRLDNRVSLDDPRMRERPLIVMECSVIAERYLGLGYSEQALALMQGYRDTCHRFGGDFTLLWHNAISAMKRIGGFMALWWPERAAPCRPRSKT